MSYTFIKISSSNNVFNPESLSIFTDILCEESILHIKNKIFNISYTNAQNGLSYSILVHDKDEQILQDLENDKIFNTITYKSYDIIKSLYDDEDGIKLSLLDRFNTMFPKIETEEDEKTIYITRIDVLSSQEIEMLHYTYFIDKENSTGIYH